RPVRGVSGTGAAYRADDPELALWVWATLVLTALGAYEDFVSSLGADDKADYYEGYKVVGHMFGVSDEVMPATYADFEDYARRTEHEVLAVGDDARAIARGIFEATVAGPTWWSRPTMQLAAAALLPPGVRRGYELPWGPGRRGTYGVVRRVVRAGRLVLPARARYWQHYRMARSRIAPKSPSPPIPPA
ncbi:MAG TPA: oxygenase MpaB family protein, partial [Acidimicrobiales bacterium]|nr:oxygenase MpaB family protein [Acidimicrobiales bacterium]